MKYFFALSLFLIIVFFSNCKKREENCKNICFCSYGFIRFDMRDATTKNEYFAMNPHLNTQNVMLYDEVGNYATNNGISWENNKNFSFLSSEIKFDFHSKQEPYGVDRKKTFYLHLDKDVDTIRVEYKIKNKCLAVDYIKAFYNNKLILGYGYREEPFFGADIVYK